MLLNLYSNMYALVLTRNDIAPLESRSVTAQNSCIFHSTNTITYKYYMKTCVRWYTDYNYSSFSSLHQTLCICKLLFFGMLVLSLLENSISAVPEVKNV